MPEIETSPGAPTRRAILKASAWSLPLVAVAVGTPLAAASVGIDLQLVEKSSGEVVGASSSDGLRVFGVAVPIGFDATTLGTTPTAAGALFVASFDTRLLGDLAVTIDGQSAPLLSTTATGNVTTATFTLPTGIPAGGAVAEILAGFGTMNFGVWVEDAEPYTVTLTPPAGVSDPNLSNNTSSQPAHYSNTTDASVSSTWTTATVPRVGGGAGFTVYIPQTVTITAVAPGNLSAIGSLSVWGPTSLLSSNPNVYTGVFTGITVVSAMLDGIDVTASLGAATGSLNSGFRIAANNVIPAGQSLVLTLDVEVDSAPREHVFTDTYGGHVQYTNQNERNPADNTVNAPTL